MRLSLFKQLELTHGTQRRTWLADMEALAVAADLFGYDTFWLGADERIVRDHQELMQALWRLSAVTSRIRLGGILVIQSQHAVDQLQREIALLSTVTGGRIRLGLDLRASCHQESAVHTMIEAFAQVLKPSRIVMPSHGVTPQQSIALIPDAALAEYAGRAGTALLLLTHETIHPTELIASYRLASEGQAGMVLAYCHINVVDGGGRKAILTPHDQLAQSRSWGSVHGTVEQAAAGLLVHQLATGADELLCDISVSGSRQSELIQSIELLGQKLLPQFALAAAERALARSAAHAELTHLLTSAVSSRRKPHDLS